MEKRYCVYLLDRYETMQMRELLRDNFTTEKDADDFAKEYVRNATVQVRVVVIGYYGNRL